MGPHKSPRVHFNVVFMQIAQVCRPTGTSELILDSTNSELILDSTNKSLIEHFGNSAHANRPICSFFSCMLHCDCRSCDRAHRPGVPTKRYCVALFIIDLHYLFYLCLVITSSILHTCAHKHRNTHAHPYDRHATHAHYFYHTHSVRRK